MNGTTTRPPPSGATATEVLLLPLVLAMPLVLAERTRPSAGVIGMVVPSVNSAVANTLAASPSNVSGPTSAQTATSTDPNGLCTAAPPGLSVTATAKVRTALALRAATRTGTGSITRLAEPTTLPLCRFTTTMPRPAARPSIMLPPVIRPSVCGGGSAGRMDNCPLPRRPDTSGSVTDAPGAAVLALAPRSSRLQPSAQKVAATATLVRWYLTAQFFAPYHPATALSRSSASATRTLPGAHTAKGTRADVFDPAWVTLTSTRGEPRCCLLVTSAWVHFVTVMTLVSPLVHCRSAWGTPPSSPSG